MFCKNCGQQINDDAIICPYCGVATGNMNNMNNAPMSDPFDGKPKNTKFCKNCGQEINSNAIICPHCGVATSQMNNMYNTPVPDMYSTPKKTNGMGIAGFVVGLIGMFGGNYLFLIPGLVGLILSIIGLVQMKKCNSANGLAIAGLVVGIISFIFWLIIWIIAFGMIINGEIPDGYYYLNQLFLAK